MVCEYELEEEKCKGESVDENPYLESNDLFTIDQRVYNTVDALDTFTDSIHGLELSEDEKMWVKNKLINFASGLKKIIASVLEEHSDIFPDEASLQSLIDYAEMIVEESDKNEGMTCEDRNQLIIELFSATKVLVVLETIELKEKTRDAVNDWMESALVLVQSIAEKIESIPNAMEAFSYIVSR